METLSFSIPPPLPRLEIQWTSTIPRFPTPDKYWNNSGHRMKVLHEVYTIKIREIIFVVTK